MDTLNQWLRGRKTNLLSAWIFAGAVAMVVNGWGDQEIAAILAAISGIAATLRAGISKTAALKALPLLIGAAVIVTAIGCAGLSKINPDTGMSGAQEIQASAEAWSAVLPPPFNMIVPLATGTVLTLLTVAGKAKDDTPPT